MFVFRWCPANALSLLTTPDYYVPVVVVFIDNTCINYKLKGACRICERISNELNLETA